MHQALLSEGLTELVFLPFGQSGRDDLEGEIFDGRYHPVQHGPARQHDDADGAFMTLSLNFFFMLAPERMMGSRSCQEQ